MQVPTDVLAVLDQAAICGSAVTLTGQLDRKLYERTDRVLKAAGGVWSRKARAHLFPGDAAEALEPVFLTGSIVSAKQEFGRFYTPPDLARRVVALAEIEPGMTVLEPSAGQGALALEAAAAGAAVFCVELDPASHEVLFSHVGERGLRSAWRGDFLAREPEDLLPERVDRVIMNPPFAKGADCRHVLHAHRFLRPGGRLVAIMSAGITFRAAFHTHVRALVAAYGGSIEPLPPGSFKASGTAVNAAVVTISARP